MAEAVCWHVVGTEGWGGDGCTCRLPALGEQTLGGSSYGSNFSCRHGSRGALLLMVCSSRSSNSLRAAVAAAALAVCVCVAGVSCPSACCLLAHCGGAMQPTSRCRCHSSRWLRCDHQLRMGSGFGVSREEVCMFMFRHRGSCWTDHGRVSVDIMVAFGGAGF